MLQLQKILVARDFSSDSEEALQLALGWAKHTKASVHTLFVEVPHGSPFEEVSQGQKQEKMGLPEHASDLHIEHAVVRDVAVAPAILKYAAEQNVDLIVLGTHGRRGVRRWLLGSIAEEVLRLAPCPVLTVRARQEVSSTEHPSILVPIDFSEHARVALRHAKALGALLGARLDLLHVVEETLHPAFYGPTLQSIYDVIPDIEEQAAAQLQQFYQTTEGPGGDVHYEVMPGKAAHAISQYAAEQESTLIVMATHGLTGLEHFFIGSVAEKVVRHAPCPVFTVKSFGRSLA